MSPIIKRQFLTTLWTLLQVVSASVIDYKRRVMFD
jgi:hypothetical protein